MSAFGLVAVVFLALAAGCSSPPGRPEPPLRALIVTEPVPTVEREEASDPQQPLALSEPPSLDLLQLDCGALARKSLAEEPVALLAGSARPPAAGVENPSRSRVPG